MRCTVVGAGAWGTALADLLARNGHEVRLWAYEPDVVESINTKHENLRFLRGHPLSSSVKALGDVNRAVEGAERPARYRDPRRWWWRPKESKRKHSA